MKTGKGLIELLEVEHNNYMIIVRTSDLIKFGCSHLTAGNSAYTCINKSWLPQDCKAAGVITPAPIDLIDGAAYMFDVGWGNAYLGFYKEDRKAFFNQLVNGNKIAAVNESKNIRPMTVVDK
jgi:hypothetical protein|tara:strand:+ start:82 stop:447 length:366 start_codon:yes stop_codon:yes gene_type:complete